MSLTNVQGSNDENLVKHYFGLNLKGTKGKSPLWFKFIPRGQTSFFCLQKNNLDLENNGISILDMTFTVCL